MNHRRNGLLLLALIALYYLLPLEFRPLWQPDEMRYAEISREMLHNGNWITPHFLGLRYFEKPAAGYWINNLGQWLFGHNNFAVRIGAVASTLTSALLLYWLGCRLFASRRIALTGSLIFLTSLLVYGVSTYAVLDPMLTLWLVAAMTLFWWASHAGSRAQRLGGWLLFGLACGMGFMTKGFLALVLPVLAIVPWAAWQRRLNELLRYGPLALLSAALISAPWALAIYHQQPDFWHYFFWVEHIQRFADQDAQHKAPFWYYLPMLIAGTLPWLALLPGALFTAWRQRTAAPGMLYLLCWTLLPLLFFSIAKGKLLTYILPCFAPLALLIAAHGHALAARASRTLRVNAVINVLFGSGAALLIILVLAPWGIGKHPLYAADELLPLSLALIAFAGWALAGALSLGAAARRWQWAALCPLALALCIGGAIPRSVENSRQPQGFIHSVSDKLTGSRYLLSDNPGIASALAWTLRRSDILLYDQQGELRYGLSYADAQGRFVSGDRFSAWLAAHRQQGTVSLVLLLDRDEPLPADLPRADVVCRSDRMLLLQYKPTP